jgi:hypothetical protein
MSWAVKVVDRMVVNGGRRIADGLCGCRRRGIGAA